MALEPTSQYPRITRYQTPGGYEFQAEKKTDGSVSVYAVDGNGRRTLLSGEAHVAYENYQLAATVSARAANDAAALLKQLHRFGEPEELAKNAGFLPLVEEWRKAKNFAAQADEFSGSYLKEALRDADRTVRMAEETTLRRLDDIVLAQALERGAPLTGEQAENPNAHLLNMKPAAALGQGDPFSRA